MQPKKIGRYAIKSELGRGGMATVYHAYDPRFERDVAVKVLPPELLHDPTFRERFEREAKTIAALEHPAIVPVYDFGEEAGQLYLVMRYMPGGSLEARMRKGAFSLAEAGRIFKRLAPAVDEAHAKGVIHRDLKPGNILFDQHGEPYLCDFGIAKLTQSSNTLTGSAIVGSPAYMSPEQGRGEPDIDGRSDIYSLGAILFEMLTGQIPYPADTPTGQIIRHVTDPVPNILQVRKNLPPACQTVISRAMAKRKHARYATASELARAVGDVSQGKTLPMPRGTLVEGEVSATTRSSQGRPLPLPTEKRASRSDAGRYGREQKRLGGRVPAGWLLGLGLAAVVLFAAFAWPGFLMPTPAPTTRATTAASPGAVVTVAAELGWARLVQGNAEYQLPGQDEATTFSEGTTLNAGPGVTIRTGSAQAVLELSDGSTVYIDMGSTLLLESVAGDGSGATKTHLELRKGRLVIQGAGLVVGAADGFPFEARIPGELSIMGVDYDSENGSYQVDCLEGFCRVEGGLGDADLPAGNGVSTQNYRRLDQPGNVAYETWLELGGTLVPTPTATALPSPTPARTLTPTGWPTKTPVPVYFATREPTDEPPDEPEPPDDPSPPDDPPSDAPSPPYPEPPDDPEPPADGGPYPYP